MKNSRLLTTQLCVLLMAGLLLGATTAMATTSTNVKVVKTGIEADTIYPYKEGFAAFWTESSVGFLNTMGEEAFDATWSDVGYLEDSTINRQIYQEYPQLYGFNEGLCAVKLDDKWAYINTMGEVVIPASGDIANDGFDVAWSFSEGLAKVRNSSGQYAYIDTSGEIVIPWATYYETYGSSDEFHNELPGDFHNGHALVRNPSSPYQYGYINRTGMFLGFLYQDAGPYNEGLAYVQELGASGKYYYIDTAGEIAIPLSSDPADGFAQAETFSEGRAIVYNDALDLRCYIDTKGNAVTDYVGFHMGPFSDGYAWNYRSGIEDRKGYIDNNGELVTDVIYGQAGQVHNGLAVVSQPLPDDLEPKAIDTANALEPQGVAQYWGIIDMQGNTLVGFDEEYQRMAWFTKTSGNFTAAKDESGWSILHVENSVSLDGAGRFDTMSKIVSQGFSLADNVVIATGRNFPDALSAAGLAGVKSAPILLTEPNELSSQAQAQIERLGAKHAYMVGGTSAITQEVEDQIESLGLEVTRVSGEDRSETALKAYDQGRGFWGDTAILATGFNYADALSISPYAYAHNAPIFLTKADGTLDEAVALAIQEEVAFGRIKHLVVTGGELVVSDEAIIAAGFDPEDSSEVVRLGGDNRYQTSHKIADFSLKNGLNFNNVAIATGLNYPDALAGGAVCGKLFSVLLLIDDSSAGRYCLDYTLFPLKFLVGEYYYLGGTSAVPQTLRDEIATELGF